MGITKIQRGSLLVLTGICLFATLLLGQGGLTENVRVARDPLPVHGMTIPQSSIDPRNLVLKENFCGGIFAEGLVGSLGWYTDAGQTGAYIARDAHASADANHACVLSLNTGPKSRSGMSIYLGFCADTTPTTGCGGGTQSRDPLGPVGSMKFDSYFIFKIQQSSPAGADVGYYNWASDDFGRTSIGVRYASTIGTDYRFETCVNGTCTDTKANSIAAVGGDWVKVRIRSTTPGKILFSICEAAGSSGCTLGPETAISTNVPTTTMTPAFKWRNLTATINETMDVNYWAFQSEVSR